MPFEDGPELPRDETWPSQTLRWWEAVRRMPHAALWDDDDWAFALDTARVAARWHQTASIPAAAELRNREKLLGMTWAFRRDLRIRYVPAQAEEERVGVTAIAEYRKLVGG